MIKNSRRALSWEELEQGAKAGYYYGPIRQEDCTHGVLTIFYDRVSMVYYGLGQMSLPLELRPLVYTHIKRNHQLELL